jgi:hypothetical protein
MAKLDKRKVVLKYLYGNIFNTHFEGKPSGYSNSSMNFSLLIGNYKYGLTDKITLVRSGEDGDRHAWALRYSGDYYYTLGIPQNQLSKLKDICSSKGCALNYSRIDGLEEICQLKLKYFSEKEIHINFTRWKEWDTWTGDKK